MTQSHSDPFTRASMLPPQAPPRRDSGLLRWLRLNLFSGPLNTLLSVAGLVIVLALASQALPWWLHSVWNANSLGECREIIAAMGGESGACWAMIKARWHQYMFGFYPQAHYWRPVLTGGLLLAALAPVLFNHDGKARWLLGLTLIFTLAALYAVGSPGIVLLATLAIFALLLLAASLRPGLLWITTGLFPFISIWLIWGGSFWQPVTQLLAVLLGYGLAGLYYRNQAKALNEVFALIIALATAWLAAGIISYSDSISGDFFARMNTGSLWPGFLAGSGLIGQLIGWILSALLWLALILIWALLGLMHVISAVLNFSLASLFTMAGATPFVYADRLSLGAIAIFALVYIAARNRSAVIGLIGGLIGGGFCLLYLAPKLVPLLAAALPLAIPAVASDQIGGFLLAIIIGVTAIASSLPLGIMLALGRRSDMFLMRILSVGFIEFIRGVPLITLLFTASLLLQYFLPPQTSFDLILRVIILASLFAAAYLAEVIRGGLAALPRGQFEAGDSLGLTYWQAQRLIVMPQALKISIPGIVSTFIGLFKDTTLVSFVGLLDPLRGVTTSVRADINWKGIYWEPYIFVGAIFFVICFGMSRYSIWLERRLKTDHR